MRLAYVAAVGLFIAAELRADPVIGQINTFQNGTAASWGAGLPFEPVVISTGGPAGAGDQYLKVSSTGGGGPGSRMIVLNRAAEWSGNWITPSATLIDLDFNHLSGDPMFMRIAFRNASGQGYISTTPFLVPDNGAWHHTSFAITAAAMTPIGGPTPFATYMQSVFEIRILAAQTIINLNGDLIHSDLGVDNIRVLPEPGLALAIPLAALLLRRRHLT